MTKVVVKGTRPEAEKLELLAVLVHEGEGLPGALQGWGGGAAARALKLGDFKGKAKQKALLYAGDEKAARLLLIGLGARRGSDYEGFRRAVGLAVGEARRLEATKLGVVACEDLPLGVDPTFLAHAMGEAAVLAGYGFDRHKGQGAAKKTPPPLTVTLFGDRQAARAAETGVAVAEATNFARDLANEPGNVGTPTHLAQAAQQAGRKYGFKVKVIDAPEMKRLGMGALLGVARGSAEPPKFIQMEYTPKGRAKGGTVALVGKGLTFDSGGISIKPADKMWEMKFDKCGGCAVIGAMVAVARTKLPVKVVGLVPCTENMPGGRATKPGDVLTALNGKTIEVLNTDAEGRLILADALAYSARFQPEAVLDMATLTGAVLVALGDVRAGMMSTHDAFAAEVRAAGERAGELVWPLPMDEAYGEHVKSDVADVKNLGKGRDAGSIAGAWFLKHFVPEKAAWAHLDIAGTAWASADPGKGYLGKGATGFGVRLAWELLRARGEV